MRTSSTDVAARLGRSMAGRIDDLHLVLFQRCLSGPDIGATPSAALARALARCCTNLAWQIFASSLAD